MGKQIAIITFLAISLAVKAELNSRDLYRCSHPNSNWTVAQVAQWASKLDVLGQELLRTPETGDRTLAFGNPVDPTCFRGLNPQQWEARKAKFEEALTLAMTQAQKCNLTLGIGGMRDSISRLRRTRFSCDVPEGYNGMAGFGVLHAPNTEHRYNMKIDPEYLDNPNNSMIDIASTIMHESLHWTVNNNRSWHNHPADHPFHGCENSRFEDRIYLIQAACFPRSQRGQYLQNDETGVAQNCPGVCERSFSTRDSNALPWYQRAFQRGVQALHGHNYTVTQSRRICSKISQMKQKFQASRQAQTQRVQRGRRFRIMVEGRVGDTSQGRSIVALINQMVPALRRAYDPDESMEAQYQLFRTAKTELLSQLQTACENPQQNSWIVYCQNHPLPNDPITQEVERMDSHFRGIDRRDFNLYTTGN